MCHFTPIFTLYSSDKLASRSQKVAFYMLHKVGGGKLVNPGDRVALVFRPDEPAQFATAFYACIFAAVIPVAIEPPITKEVGIIWKTILSKKKLRTHWDQSFSPLQRGCPSLEVKMY